MPRTGLALSLLLWSAALHAAPAHASYTIDLIWADTGTSHISVDIGSLVSTDPGTLCRTGRLSEAGDGRCLLIQLTAEQRFTAAVVSLGWHAATSGITVDFVPERSFGRFGAKGATGWGPAHPSVSTVRDCFPACDTKWGGFGGVAVSPVAAGTYIIGSVNLDTAGTLEGLHSIGVFQAPGLGVSDEQSISAPVQLNSATIAWVPEPGSVSLLGLGVLGLAWLGRTRKA